MTKPSGSHDCPVDMATRECACLKCESCGHRPELHCPQRGCRVIVTAGYKTHDPNELCGCKGS